MRILAIDYGTKRIGLAVSDPLQIIATPLETVPTQEALSFLQAYCEKEPVEAFVVGKPTGLDGNPTEITTDLENFLLKLIEVFPKIKIHRIDERFTSKIAEKVLAQSGKSKKARQQKGQVDKIAAAIMLQEFMYSRR